MVIVLSVDRAERKKVSDFWRSVVRRMEYFFIHKSMVFSNLRFLLEKTWGIPLTVLEKYGYLSVSQDKAARLNVPLGFWVFPGDNRSSCSFLYTITDFKWQYQVRLASIRS